MTNDYVELILDAVKGLQAREDLRVEADDLSTLIVGPSAAMFEAVRNAFVTAAKSGEHVVANVTFSRGCPGEPDDPLCTPEEPEAGGARLPDPRTTSKTGVTAAAQFAVYPLGISDYMNAIAEEIERSREAGTFTGGKHFCSRLDDDCGPIFATLHAAFEKAGERAGHAVVTASVSANSPSGADQT